MNPSRDQRELADIWTKVRDVVRVLAPGTFVVSLFFYFGVRYTDYHYRQYGLDHAALGYSTSDYVMRSLNVTVQPLRAVAVAVLVAVGAHVTVVAGLYAVRRWRPSAERASAGAVGCIVLGVGMIGTAVYWTRDPGNLVNDARWWLVSLLMVAYGVFVVAYMVPPAGWLSSVGENVLGEHHRRAIGAVLIALLLTMIAYAAFELTRVMAWERALRQAMVNEAEPSAFPLVRILSTRDLGLDEALDVPEQRISGNPGDFQYVYENVRLFVQKGDHLVLWPRHRSPRSGMFILVLSADLRVEYEPELR